MDSGTMDHRKSRTENQLFRTKDFALKDFSTNRQWMTRIGVERDARLRRILSDAKLVEENRFEDWRDKTARATQVFFLPPTYIPIASIICISSAVRVSCSA